MWTRTDVIARQMVQQDISQMRLFPVPVRKNFDAKKSLLSKTIQQQYIKCNDYFDVVLTLYKVQRL